MADSASGSGGGAVETEYARARAELKASAELLVALQALVGSDYEDKSDQLPAALAAAEEGLDAALKAFAAACAAQPPPPT